MKRMSVAEQTLKKQIERMKHDVDILIDTRDGYTIQIDTLLNQIEMLKSEQAKLAKARVDSSIRNGGL